MATMQQSKRSRRKHSMLVAPPQEAEQLSAAERIHLELIIKKRLDQIPEQDRYLPGYQRTMQRIVNGEEKSPSRIATALNFALVNALLAHKIVPYGMNWGETSIDD